MLRTALVFVLSLAALLSLTPLALAEVATEDEARQVAENWLTYIGFQVGNWAGQDRPSIVGVTEIALTDTLLGWCFSVSPKGNIVVPALKELPPVKTYSDRHNLDVDDADGFPKLLKEQLQSRFSAYASRYGSLDAPQPPAGEVLFSRTNAEEWQRFLQAPSAFRSALSGGRLEPMTEVGPLLTTEWQQGDPYNQLCPDGDGGQCIVGCVATAAAQIMRYHSHPPFGLGTFCHEWNGDNSCGGSTGDEDLCVDFSDDYAWSQMPDDCTGGCTTTQQEALAELCYEVGVALEMDYGHCESGAYTSDALWVMPMHFFYDEVMDLVRREDYDAEVWFWIIQIEVDAGRPMLYSFDTGPSSGHAVVCDGWRDTGGMNQYHMNYGWGDSYTTWYVLDNLDFSIHPFTEELVRYIKPRDVEVLDTVYVNLTHSGHELGTADYPFDTIQEGIDAVAEGGTVYVAPGTYAGVGNRDLDFDGKAFELIGTDGQDNTIIDCEGAARGFYFHSGEVTTAVVQGFRVQNGVGDYGGGVYCNDSSPTLTDCTFEANEATSGGGIACYGSSSPTLTGCTFSGNLSARGGGMYCHSSSPTLTGCTFSDNVGSTYGGGMYCSISSPTLENCTFSGNVASSTSVGTSGGGVACIRSSPALTDCTFSGNVSSYHGGGMYCSSSSSPTLTGCTFSGNVASYHGGGMYCSSSSPALTDCIFSSNNAFQGGGMYCYSSSSPTVTDCTFSGNLSARGSGMYCHRSSPTLTGCTFSDNVGSTYSGGISCYYSSPILENCTFFGNAASSSSYGGGMDCFSSSPTLENCIIAFSPSGMAVSCYSGSEPVLVCCDIYGNAGGDWVGCIAALYGVNGNFSMDPLFCDPETGDFTLRDDSPCLPENNSCCELIGAYGLGSCPTGVPEIPEEMTNSFALYPASPNPSEQITTIAFDLPEPTAITLAVFDVAGRRVKTLAEDKGFPAGRHTLRWDGSDDSGKTAASGVYFYRIEAGGRKLTERVVLLR